MVRTSELSAHLPGVSLKEYQDIFEDHESFREYVYSISQDKRIKITPWTGDSQGAQHRRATYWLPLDAPEWFKKTTGARKILLNDSQNVVMERDASGNLNMMRSTSAPALMVPWRKEGYSIATITFTVTREVHNGVHGCRMVANVSCSAKELQFLWGMHGAVEKIMEAQTNKSTQRFLEFCACKCAQFAVRLGRPVELPVGFKVEEESDDEVHSPTASLVSQTSIYYDIEDDPLLPAMPHFKDRPLRRFSRKAAFFLCCCGRCSHTSP